MTMQRTERRLPSTSIPTSTPNPVEPIRTTDELAAVCARFAAQPFVTVDTEFLRETTYYPLLCVAQIASADEAVVIDTLAEGLDLDAVSRSDGERERHQGVPRRAPGHRNRLAHGASAFRIRSSTRRSPRWCSAMATRFPTISSCSASPAIRSTSRTASPTGRAGRSPRRSLTYAVSDVTHLRDIYLKLTGRTRKARPHRMGQR